VLAEEGASLIEPVGFLSIAGAPHTTYKYVYLCHKSRGFSYAFALLPVANCALKLEVIFCVQAVISPLLANIYLHYIFDLWVQVWRRQMLKRSQRHRRRPSRLAWLADRWLPRPRVLHPWPSPRFAASHPR
jgi:hypothetical protein